MNIITRCSNARKAGTAYHNINIDAKFASQTTHHSHKSGNTTSTTCYGEKKCRSEIKFITGHDSRNSSSI
jgi:hypothetical protein